MRVFIDTNILISAALFPGGTAAVAYEKAVLSPNSPIVSDYVIEEMRRVFARKFPGKLMALDSFLAALSSCVEIVATPDLEVSYESVVRDPNDRPILRAALASRADVILTGDKDLLESGIASPKMLSAGEFIAL